MLGPRWHKVLADLWANKMRTLLVILSVAVGVSAVGMMATSYTIFGRDMDASWQAIDPAGAIMFTSYFDSDFLDSLRHVAGAGQVEGRARLGGFKLHYGDAPARGLTLQAAPNFARVKLDRAFLLEGAWPERREIAIERNSLRQLPVKAGDMVQVEMADGKLRELKVAGILEDRTMDASDATVNGYITLDTLDYLGQPRDYNFLQMTVAEQANDKEHVREVARAVEEQFSRNGGLVGATIVREPGKHPSATQSVAVMGLLMAMGVLTVILSALLVINTVSALMGQQIRYIGVMKALGARTGQIMGMYIVLLLALGALALLIAAPLGMWGGYRATERIAAVLNFQISPFRIEVGPAILMVVLSLGVPLLAGLLPVRNGARTTIREAISGYGLNNAVFGRGLIDRGFSHLRFVSRPMRISLRNTIRRKARLALTLATLVLAGAIFMGVLSAQGSMSASVEKLFHYFLADVNVDFDRSYRVGNIAELVGQIPGVAQVEGWIFAAAEVQQGDSKVAIDRITVMAPPKESALVEREVLSGRWLLPDDQNAIVMSTGVMAAHPEWKIGDSVRLKLNTKVEDTFVIVGIFPFASGDGNKISMASYDYLADLLNSRGQASSFRIVTAPHDAATQDRVRDALTAQFKEMGYNATVASGHSNIDSLGAILNTIVLFLLFMAFLIAVVGGLGLMGTMGMNVLERTREIGVMRSIGASNGVVVRLVLVEGILIGLLSWVGGALLGVPIGQLLSAVLGQGLFGNPFAFILAWNGLALWLAIVIVLSILASLVPALNAARLTVREVLAYE